MQQRSILNPHIVLEAGGVNPYADGLLEVIENLRPALQSKQMVDLERKLQLYSKDVNEVQYLQAACEATICGYFAGRYPMTFQYEPVLTAPKDVDCSFEDAGFRFNIEVKCADYSKKNALDQEKGFQLGVFGRHPDLQTMTEDLASALGNDPEGRPLLTQQHMDNKLKDFLLSAHGKFRDSQDDETVNVLAVCCDDPSDMQKWFGYLYGHQGLFTDQSFHRVSEYERVDIVLLNNLYHRHYNYRQKSQLESHWDFGKAFNLIFSNPKRQRDKRAAIMHLTQTFPNHSWQLFHYEVPGEAPAEVKHAIKLSHYVVDNLVGSGMFHLDVAADASGEL